MKWNGETLTVVLARTKANQRDFLSSVLIRIHDRVHKWEELGKMRSLVSRRKSSWAWTNHTGSYAHVRCDSMYVILSSFLSSHYGGGWTETNHSAIFTCLVDRSAFGCEPSEQRARRDSQA